MSDERERDHALGTALRELPVPEHRPEFFSELAALLREERREAPVLPARRLWYRRPLVAVAAATAVVAIAGAVLVFPRPNPAFAVLEEAEDRFAESPPFRAVISAPPAKSRLSYRDQAGWRLEPVDASAGTYTLWDGKKLYTYNPSNNMYEVKGLGGKELNLLGFFIWKADGGIQRWEARCGDAPGEVLPNEVVVGRDSRHVICGDFELWVDAETGLMLKITSHEPVPGGVQPEPRPIGLFPGNTLEVVEIEYDPSFPEGAFEFVAPPGARESQGEPEPEPVNEKLKVGAVAPSWSGDLLAGGSFDVESLRGRPAVVLFWAPWCEACIGEPLSQFEIAYRKHSNALGLVSVSYDKRDATLEIVNQRTYSFPVVVDEPGRTLRRWGLSGIPTLVLLDAKGRVMGNYLGLFSNEDFERLLDALAQGRPLPNVSPRP